MNWYAIYTKPRHEHKVNDRLLKKRFETFLPLFERWSRRKDRKKKLLVPLFPGYLFVRTIINPYTHLEILKTESVVRILGHNGKPEPIPEEQINAIQTVIKHGIAISPHSYLKEGERVRIINGPLAGIEGILVKTLANKRRLVLSIDILKESASVEIEDEDVELVNI